MNNNNNKKNVMLAFMSGDQTWKQKIRLRTQATYEKKIDRLINYLDVNQMSNIYKLKIKNTNLSGYYT